MPSDAVLSPG